MFIKKISIKNFRLFSSCSNFEIDNINIPDGINEGSGLTIFVGENGCGKTSLLEAFALPLLSYKSDGFSLNDLFDPNEKTKIEIFSEKNFEFDGTMPKVKYKGKGFLFEAGLRAKDTKSYLSSIIVTDQRYIRADGEVKPEDGKPDLRVSVNNPWKGARFNENEILFIDKNRTFQIRSGTYNRTKFDRLMEDFDYQYIKRSETVTNLNEQLDKTVKQGSENKFLAEVTKKFKEVSGHDIRINFIDNWKPFSTSFFAEKKENNLQINLGNLGSGFEMIFSLFYSFYLAQQSGKQLIVLIDEPELHLHPKLQEDFVKILLEFSKTTQIILTTHSSLFIKQILYNEHVKANIIVKENDFVQMKPVEERILSFVSSGEINFLAFGLATEEYHNELYEELNFQHGGNRGFQEFDKTYFQKQKNEPANSPWKGKPNEVSIHTFLRNQIHHLKDNGRPDVCKLKSSILKMRGYLMEDSK